MLKDQIKELKRQKRIHGQSVNVTASEIEKLRQQMPIQKIMGFINFDDVMIKLDRKVFIPRYETEEVVHHALKYIKAQSRVLDLCSGSGYIGLTIKKKTNATVVLADNDDEAIIQAQENAKINNLDVEIIKSNLFENIKNQYDVIVSNPPYMPLQVVRSNAIKDFEPKRSIFGGKDGNKFYQSIIKELPKYIKNHGYVIFEICRYNSAFLIANGFKIFKDMNQKDRIAIKQFHF